MALAKSTSSTRRSQILSSPLQHSPDEMAASEHLLKGSVGGAAIGVGAGAGDPLENRFPMVKGDDNDDVAYQVVK